MEFDELVQYFNSDEDSINIKPPSFLDSSLDENNSEISNAIKSDHYEPVENKKLNFYEYNTSVLEIENNDKIENALDIFSDSECSEISKYSDNSSFTWGNGDKEFAILTETQIQNTLDSIEQELYYDDNVTNEENNTMDNVISDDFHNNGYGDKNFDFNSTLSDYLQRLIDSTDVDSKNNNTRKSVKFASNVNEAYQTFDKENNQNNFSYIRKHKHQLVKSNDSNSDIIQKNNIDTTDIINDNNDNDNDNDNGKKSFCNNKNNSDENCDSRNIISNINKQTMLYEPHPPQEKHNLFHSKSDSQRQNNSNVKTSFVRHHTFVSSLKNNNSSISKIDIKDNSPQISPEIKPMTPINNIANDGKVNSNSIEDERTNRNSNMNESNTDSNRKNKIKNYDLDTVIIKMNSKSKKGKKKRKESNQVENKDKKEEEEEEEDNDDEDNDEVVEFFNKLNDPEKRKSIKNFVISFDSDSDSDSGSDGENVINNGEENNIEHQDITKEALSDNDQEINITIENEQKDFSEKSVFLLDKNNLSDKNSDEDYYTDFLRISYFDWFDEDVFNFVQYCKNKTPQLIQSYNNYNIPLNDKTNNRWAIFCYPSILKEDIENKNEINKINIINIIDSNRSSVDNSINGLVKYLVEQKDNIHSNLLLKNYLEKNENESSSILNDYLSFQYFAIYYSQKPINNHLDKNIFLQSSSTQTNYSHESENYSLKSKFINSSLKKNEIIPGDGDDDDNNDYNYITFIQWNQEKDNNINNSYIHINVMDISIQFMDFDLWIYEWNINLDGFNNSNSSTLPFLKDSFNQIEKSLYSISISEYDEPELFMKPSITFQNGSNEEIFEENECNENSEYLESKMLLGLDVDSDDEFQNSIVCNGEHWERNNEVYESYNNVRDDSSSVSRIHPSAPIPTPNSSIMINFSEKEENEIEKQHCTESDKKQENISFLQSHKDELFREIWKKTVPLLKPLVNYLIEEDVLIKSSKFNEQSLSPQESHIYILNYESECSSSNIIYFPDNPSRSQVKEIQSSESNQMFIENKDSKSDILKIDQIYSLDTDDHILSTKMPRRWKRILTNNINDSRKKDKEKFSVKHQLCLKKYYKYLIR
ncbi:hypothetical protein PIROE2DRAFT_62372 [Piromyces sp. E2]|nr:hypothetical protein PIROE2DRAFT_62372 [Piromyces sp. E2]|eukprot:OUM61657.1 hypothetical protein PIROE2DRAFT_62372 [Piromyces sp. E2]